MNAVKKILPLLDMDFKVSFYWSSDSNIDSKEDSVTISRTRVM
jgi:hypothetical protein